MRVIDALTAGFNTVLKRLWLLALPVVLDGFFWLGPKLSIAQIMQRMLSTVRHSMDLIGPAELDGTASQLIDAATLAAEQAIGGTNLFVLLAWDRLGVPTIGILQQINPKRDVVIEIASTGQLLIVQFLLLLIGLFVTCIFLGMLGQVVRGEAFSLEKLAGRVPTYFLYMIAFVIPLGIMLVILFSSTLLLGSLSLIAWVVGLWILLYMSFVPEAITLTEASPIKAMLSSFAIVRLNLWSVIGLTVLVNVISIGLNLIWQMLVGTPVGTFVAIMLNAYVGTSLTVAYFIFFRDRLTRWYELVKQQRSS